jgi:endonuclease YncB( thermonuclease family)
VSRKPVEFANWPPELAVPFGPFRAFVRHLVDGDTFDAFIDLGFNTYQYNPVRLLGVDTPEINRAATREAGYAALEFVRHVMPIGSRVLLHTRKDPDSFGRYLARVTLADGADLGTLILDAGHGVPYERT